MTVGDNWVMELWFHILRVAPLHCWLCLVFAKEIPGSHGRRQEERSSGKPRCLYRLNRSCLRPHAPSDPAVGVHQDVAWLGARDAAVMADEPRAYPNGDEGEGIQMAGEREDPKVAGSPLNGRRSALKGNMVQTFNSFKAILGRRSYPSYPMKGRWSKLRYRSNVDR